MIGTIMTREEVVKELKVLYDKALMYNDIALSFQIMQEIISVSDYSNK